MKKIICAMVISSVLVSGCAVFCKHGQAVLDGLGLAIVQADAIIAAVEAQYPGSIPPAVLAALQAAKMAKEIANAAFIKACPVPADLTAAQSQLTKATQTLSLVTQGQAQMKKAIKQ